MRKSWRSFLGSIAALILLLALFVWDAIRRAEAAIDAHERQVALDIAALRAAHARQPFISSELRSLYPTGSLSLTTLRRFEALIDAAVFFQYEMSERVDPWLWVPPPASTSAEDPPPRPDQALADLALPQDILRGGGRVRALCRQSLETDSIQDWKRLLQEHTLSVEKLQSIAERIDSLLQTRPPIRQALEGESILDRLRVIRVLHTHSDEDNTVTEKPGWRAMFLWRLHIARTLRAIDSQYRDLIKIASLDPHLREGEALRLEDHWEDKGLLPPVSRWPAYFSALFKGEAETLRDWMLLRVALAIAQYELDQARCPDTLEELVPQYIGQIPLNPETGHPFSYSKGSIAVRFDPGEVYFWRIARRSKASGQARDP